MFENPRWRLQFERLTGGRAVDFCANEMRRRWPIVWGAEIKINSEVGANVSTVFYGHFSCNFSLGVSEVEFLLSNSFHS